MRARGIDFVRRSNRFMKYCSWLNRIWLAGTIGIVGASLAADAPKPAEVKTTVPARGDVVRYVAMPGSLRAGEELDAALRASDLFVMPHRTTDFGRAFFDAMAAGLPVLAFRTPASATASASQAMPPWLKATATAKHAAGSANGRFMAQYPRGQAPRECSG